MNPIRMMIEQITHKTLIFLGMNQHPLARPRGHATKIKKKPAENLPTASQSIKKMSIPSSLNRSKFL
jgi:hypothetical protein